MSIVVLFFVLMAVLALGGLTVTRWSVERGGQQGTLRARLALAAFPGAFLVFMLALLVLGSPAIAIGSWLVVLVALRAPLAVIELAALGTKG